MPIDPAALEAPAPGRRSLRPVPDNIFYAVTVSGRLPRSSASTIAAIFGTVSAARRVRLT